LKYKLDSRFT